VGIGLGSIWTVSVCVGGVRRSKMIKWILATWLFIFVVVYAFAAFACDTGFLQEPTTREADTIEYNTVIGFIYKTYLFMDGRSLVVVYQTRDILSGPEPFPLFYIVTDATHTSIVYIDVEGYGNCFDIKRYP
jgi:hypothetical protein